MKFVDSERKNDGMNIWQDDIAYQGIQDRQGRAVCLLKGLTGKTNKAIGEIFDIGDTAISKAYSSI